jgi:hypothetical protein
VAGNTAEARFAELRPIIAMAGLDQAIHEFLLRKARRGCPAPQTSLRSLRKADCYGRARRRRQQAGSDPALFATVIARSEATKQSIVELPLDGLLRFARNDV